jgi:hypothetical protein
LRVANPLRAPIGPDRRPQSGVRFGVVDVLVVRKSAEHGLPQIPCKRAPAILARAGVGERVARHRTEAERLVAFAADERPDKAPRNWSVKSTNELERVAGRLTREEDAEPRQPPTAARPGEIGQDARARQRPSAHESSPAFPSRL